MICPHCKKPISRLKHFQVSPEVKEKALRLHAEGYSLRDIEYKLDRQISFATVSRLIKEQAVKEK